MSNTLSDPISPTKPKETAPSFQAGASYVETKPNPLPTGGTLYFQKPSSPQTLGDTIAQLRNFFQGQGTSTKPPETVIAELSHTGEGTAQTSPIKPSLDKPELVALATRTLKKVA
ncbi:hypothetical protein HYU95_01465 [Candidatus Daviesbacteria bacterium]|nr:hypothetical protein [Candidatus Daviesbacteria bacterium]